MNCSVTTNQNKIKVDIVLICVIYGTCMSTIVYTYIIILCWDNMGWHLRYGYKHEPAWFLLNSRSGSNYTLCCKAVWSRIRLAVNGDILPAAELRSASNVHKTNCLFEFLVHKSVYDRIHSWIREPDDLYYQTNQTIIIIVHVII